MTPEEKKLQAAIAAAMQLPKDPEPEAPFPQAAAVKQAEPVVPQSAPKATVPAEPQPQQAEVPAPLDVSPVPTAAESNSDDGDYDWSAVEKEMEENVNKKQSKKKAQSVVINAVFYLFCAGIIGYGAFWYYSSEENQAKMAGLLDDVKKMKDDVNPVKMAEGYQEALGKIEEHQDRIGGEGSFSWDAVNNAEPEEKAETASHQEPKQSKEPPTF